MTRTLEETKLFVEEYLRLAHNIKLPLAPLDKPEKSFFISTERSYFRYLF